MPLIDASGQPRWGLIDEPVDRVNFDDFDLRTVMDRPRSRWARRFGHNQFQFVGVMGREWLAGVAVVDLKWIANAFFYLYDFREGRLLEHSSLQPLAWGTRIDSSPDTGSSRFAQGSTQVSITPLGDAREVVVQQGKDVSMRFRVAVPAAFETLRLCSRAGYSGWVYTQKSAGLPVSGEVRWGDYHYTTDADHRASIDWSGGFMRRETAWNWACLAGVTEQGVSIGLNLAAGVNETGVTENALWVDGRRTTLAPADFRFQRYRPEEPWQVSTSDGRVDLRFLPAGVRKERVNLGLLASNFRQFYGHFEGHLTDDQGNTHSLVAQPGLMEDHFARW
ncbi:DUF2804 domain-containing protein [Mangrovitalea sediminis]|uniref:DUF2804 domain-containing protein n=1 Tax=Mangrovitalea sediminis TaxID=1982043 RepID=UPI001D0D08C2|nr:DUF2804 domain-containing protein [Mangrovitalea sediminis]